MAESSGPKVASARWGNTINEVAEGSMSGPFSVEDVQRTRGGFVNVVPSFGLEQGNDEDGWPLRLPGQFGGP